MGSRPDTGGGSEKGSRDWAGGGGEGTHVTRVVPAIEAAFAQQRMTPVSGEAGLPLMTSQGCHGGKQGQQV